MTAEAEHFEEEVRRLNQRVQRFPVEHPWWTLGLSLLAATGAIFAIIRYAPTQEDNNQTTQPGITRIAGTALRIHPTSSTSATFDALPTIMAVRPSRPSPSPSPTTLIYHQNIDGTLTPR